MAYKQLTYPQRCKIFALRRRGFSCRSIAADIGVHHTTVSRELRRNSSGRGYRHDQAHRMSLARRHRSGPGIAGDLRQLIHRKLALKWSPDQIAGWLRRHEIAHLIASDEIPETSRITQRVEIYDFRQRCVRQVFPMTL